MMRKGKKREKENGARKDGLGTRLKAVMSEDIETNAAAAPSVPARPGHKPRHKNGGKYRDNLIWYTNVSQSGYHVQR